MRQQQEELLLQMTMMSSEEWAAVCRLTNGRLITQQLIMLS
jgi:hypothetical protein